jgi:ankyrin repeat protein
LRAAGAELNQVTAINGYSALHGAVQGDQLEVVQWLLQEGIDRNIKISDGKFAGMTARKMAQELGREDILKVLS